eukprot:TRINITY_DN569_c1_g1_i1.p1 TRINITY_DN569_c1_g1~~TRINITY_DN569_c1_g1_i1.p1  ORF type:complete len:808 (-),score=160.74 TRINITY_DN569_c1_g1_i1:172-2595(-)
MAYAQRKAENSAALTLQSAGRMYLERRRYLHLQKESKYRTEVSRELLSTEEYYLNQLRMVVEVFVLPLKKAAETGRPILSEAEIRAIFSTIEVIVRINTELLQQLKSRTRDWGPNQKLGDVFVKMADCFKIYTNYVQHFSEALKVVQECNKRSELFTDFCKKGFVDMGDPLASLSSYLITPIQRIPRYQLLLKDLLKHTWSDHPDFDDITLALDLITKTAVHVNEKQKEAENISKCISVQNSLSGKKIENLLDSSRRFVREGQLTEVVLEGKGKTIKMKKRWFFLFSDIVVRCELPNQKSTIKRRSSSVSVNLASGQDNRTYEYLGKLHLQKASIVNMGDEGEKKHAFELVTAHDSLWLCSDSEEDKEQWMQSISECIRSSTSRADAYDRHLTEVAAKKASTAKTLIDSKYIALRVHGGGAKMDDLESSSYHSLTASERLDLEQRAAERVRNLAHEEKEQNELAKQRGADFQAYLSNKHNTYVPSSQNSRNSTGPIGNSNSNSSSNSGGKKKEKARRGTASSADSSSPRRAFANLKRNSSGKARSDTSATKVIDYPNFGDIGEEGNDSGSDGLAPRLQRSPGIRSLSIEAIAQAEEEEKKKRYSVGRDGGNGSGIGSGISGAGGGSPDVESPRLRKFASLRRESIGATAPAGLLPPKLSPTSSEPSSPQQSKSAYFTSSPVAEMLEDDGNNSDGDSPTMNGSLHGSNDSESSPRLRKFAKLRRDSYNSLPRPGMTESAPATLLTTRSNNGPSSPQVEQRTASTPPSPATTNSPSSTTSGSPAADAGAPRTRKFAQRNNLYKNLGTVS